ncbi:MAG: wax ester/triacylglycerol synthase family O-acyltransferase [Gammaproteobacteria bacterium]|nr:wax ester/triacylglycerol synthase family O-acyltransferase [Gammaproteobacteria bacterium]
MLKQLSGLDSMFLYSENSRMPLEVSSLHIYDPSTAPQGKVRFKEVLATINERLVEAGIFHRKILEVPFSLDHPYWVEDENFDIEYHVRHIALPKPGDWRQLMIQVSRLQSRELDKTRPLWEAYIIEGLDNVGRLPKGCFALFMKMHHATIDGVSGAALQAAIHDLEPIEPTSAEIEPTIRDLSDASPGVAQLLARSTVNNVAKSARLFLGIGSAIPRLIKAKMSTPDGDQKEEVPSTIFNRGRVTANRVIDGRQFDLAELRAIAKSQENVKINDVALAIVSGALRKYLETKDDLPAEPLIAACPLNVRSDQSADADNMVSMMNTSLRTDIVDPIDRLQAIVEGSRKAKEFTEILGADTLTVIPMNLPAFFARSLMPPLMNLAVRFDAVSFNTMVSNVAGIQRPLYFCGAKMVSMYGMGPVVDQAGLFHAVFSYDGKITFTFTACREMLPDPEFYAECLQASFDELKKKTIRKKTRARKRTA